MIVLTVILAYLSIFEPSAAGLGSLIHLHFF